MIEMMKSKLHRARVTEANINYIGSITIDEELMEASELIENEKVSIYNITNGMRFDTYVIKGKRNSGEICMNGAAARLVQVDDLIIIISYCILEKEEAKKYKPKIIILSEKNQII